MTTLKKGSFWQDKQLAFNIFHVVFSIVILLASLKTVAEAMDTSNWALLVLAGTEVIAVVFFVLPKFTKSGGIALMVIFFIAITLSLVTGIIMNQLHLIAYLVCTYFIVVHGNVLRGPVNPTEIGSVQTISG